MGDSFFTHDISDLSANRLAASNYIYKTTYYETDTQLIFQIALDGAGNRIWVSIGPPGPLPVEIVVSPLLDQELVVMLPDLATQPDGQLRLCVFNGKALGAAVGVITAFGAQTVGRAGLNWYRLSEGGTVLLRAVPGSNLWDIAGEQKGSPQVLSLTVDPAAGSDSNPGTVARPLLTVVAGAGSIARRTPWYQDGKVTVTGGGSEDIGDSPFMIPQGVGPNATPFQIIGTAFDVAPGFAASYTTNAAGSAYANGPPIVLTRFAIPVTAAFGADGARGFFVRPINGLLAGRRLAVAASTTTTVDTAGSYVAPGNNTTFVVETPAYTIDGTAFGIGCALQGSLVQITGIQLGSTEYTQQDCVASLYACKIADLISLTRSVLQTGGAVLGTMNAVPLAFAAILPANPDGVVFRGAIVGDQGSTVLLESSVLANATNDGESAARPYFAWFVAHSSLTGAVRYSGVALIWQDVVARDGSLVLSGASGVDVVNMTFANTAAGAFGIRADYGSSCVLTQIQGTVTGGQDPVSAQHASHVSVTDANVGTTVSDGAGRNAIVGVLGNKTWANIAAAAYANINDNAGAPAGGTGSTIAPG